MKLLKKKQKNKKEIDVCVQWTGMSKEEKDAQKCGVLFVCGGLVSCIKESHIEPCATKELVCEAFEKGKAKISAKIIKQRLPNVLKTIEKREKQIYFSSNSTIKRVKNTFKSFVKLIEQKEKETNSEVTIFVSFKGD